MGSKKSIRDQELSEAETYTVVSEPAVYAREEPIGIEPEAEPPQRRRPILPALTIGDILALLTLIVLSAALLLEGYHKEFKDYSKEIVALFAVVVGFLLGRKT